MAEADAIFWDRIEDMPWDEAEDECVSRREQVVLQIALLQSERVKAIGREHARLGSAIFEDMSQMTRLNERIKRLRRNLDRTNWAKAVTAIFGVDGFTACREWMASTEFEIRRRERDHGGAG